jgi:predicted ester cyclase
MTSATATDKSVVAELMDALDRRDIDGLLAHCAPNAVWYGYAPEPIDNNGYRAAIGAFLDGFTDSRFPVQALVAEGDRVACLHHLVGTHLGTFQGAPASGRPVRVTGIAIFRLANGQVVETWLSADLVGLMMQIGAIPAPGAA